MDRINEIQARLAAINTELENASGDTLTNLENEARSLTEELKGIRDEAKRRQELRASIAAGAGTPAAKQPAPAQASPEQRAADNFAKTNRMTIDAEQSRSVLVSSDKLVQPTKIDGINDITGAKVSGLLDLIKVVNCVGMGSHRIAFVDTDAEVPGGHTEGMAITPTGSAAFDFVTITPETIAVIDYISKQAKRQTTLQYSAKVKEQALIALRRAAIDNVVNTLIDDEKMITNVTAGTAGKWDEKTLRKIALSYGGDESVLGGAVLVLHKNDLIALGDVRGTNEKLPVYEITPDANGTTGTIRDGGLTVRYCICSRTMSEGRMYYGNPQALELDLFSDYEIAVSEDFAFDKLMDTIRGDVDLGVGITAKGAWYRVSNGAE